MIDSISPAYMLDMLYDTRRHVPAFVEVVCRGRRQDGGHNHIRVAYGLIHPVRIDVSFGELVATCGNARKDTSNNGQPVYLFNFHDRRF